MTGNSRKAAGQSVVHSNVLGLFVKGLDGMVSGMKTIVNAVDPFENTQKNNQNSLDAISDENEEDSEGETERIETKKKTRQLRSSNTRVTNTPNANKRTTFDSLRSFGSF